MCHIITCRSKSYFNTNRFLHLWDHRHSNRNHVIRWKVTLIWSLINIDEFILGPRFTFLIPEQKVNDIRYLKSKKENLPLLSFCEDLMILVLRIIMILTFFIYMYLTFAGFKGPLYVFSWKCVQKWSYGYFVIYGTTFDHFRLLWRHFWKIQKIIYLAIFGFRVIVSK